MTNEIDELIWRVLEGEASPDELHFLANWIKDEDNKRYFRQLKKVWNLTGGPKLAPERKAKELNRFLNTIHVHSASRMNRRRLVGWSKYAAILFIPLLFAVYLLWSTSENRDAVKNTNMIQAGTARATLTMADGKTVVLQPDSTIDIQMDGAVRVKSAGKGIVYQTPKQQVTEIQYNTLTIPRGGEYTLVLADGTKVYMNSVSKLKYPVAFASDRREVELEGEAYFEVAHDSVHPFIVRTKEVCVKVYGTEFNVNTYKPGIVQTVLVKGKVGVTVNDTGEEQMMKPNELLEYNGETGKMEVREVDPSFYTAWVKSEFMFMDARLEDIMEQLSRWYGVEVFYSNEEVKNRKFTGNAARFEDIRNILRIMEKTGIVSFSVKDRTVVISNGNE